MRNLTDDPRLKKMIEEHRARKRAESRKRLQARKNARFDFQQDAKQDNLWKVYDNKAQAYVQMYNSTAWFNTFIDARNAVREMLQDGVL